MKTIKTKLIILLSAWLWVHSNYVSASGCSDLGTGWSQARLAKPKIEFCYPSKYSIQIEKNHVFIVSKVSSNHRQTFFSKNKLDLVFQGKRVLEPSDYVTHIKVGNGSFKKANAAERIFEKNNNVMQARIGRVTNPKPAKSISNDGWSGYEAIVACSISDENGFHAVAGECLWAIGSNNKNYFVVDTLPDHGTIDEAIGIVKTIRFSNL